MPCAVDYILEGLAKNLEVTRECGAFAVEFDRDFLARLPKERTVRNEAPAAVAEKPGVSSGSSGSSASRTSSPTRTSRPVAAQATRFDFVFLHHAAMAGASAEMMTNVITRGIKKTPETAPIVFEGERPPAKIYVVLGAKALAKWYEGVSLLNGGWFKDVDSEVFYTWSPEDIFRFGTTLTPAMKQKKMDMWKGLQEGMRKLSEK